MERSEAYSLLEAVDPVFIVTIAKPEHYENVAARKEDKKTNLLFQVNCIWYSYYTAFLLGA